MITPEENFKNVYTECLSDVTYTHFLCMLITIIQGILNLSSRGDTFDEIGLSKIDKTTFQKWANSDVKSDIRNKKDIISTLKEYYYRLPENREKKTDVMAGIIETKISYCGYQFSKNDPFVKDIESYRTFIDNIFKHMEDCSFKKINNAFESQDVYVAPITNIDDLIQESTFLYNNRKYEKCIEKICNVDFSLLDDRPLDKIRLSHIKLMCYYFENDNYTKLSSVSEFEQIKDDCTKLLKKHENDIEKEIYVQLLIERASILTDLASVYWRGNNTLEQKICLDGAKADLEKIADLKKIADPKENILLSVIYNRLGLAHRKEFEFEEAIKAYTDSVELFCNVQELSNEEKYRLSISYGNLGILYRKVNLFSKADEAYNKAIQLRKELLSDVSSEMEIKDKLPILYTNYAELLRKQHDFEKAKRLSQEATTDRSSFTLQNPDKYNIALSNSRLLLASLPNTEGADTLFENVWRIRENMTHNSSENYVLKIISYYNSYSTYLFRKARGSFNLNKMTAERTLSSAEENFQKALHAASHYYGINDCLAKKTYYYLLVQIGYANLLLYKMQNELNVEDDTIAEEMFRDIYNKSKELCNHIKDPYLKQIFNFIKHSVVPAQCVLANLKDVNSIENRNIETHLSSSMYSLTKMYNEYYDEYEKAGFNNPYAVSCAIAYRTWNDLYGCGKTDTLNQVVKNNLKNTFGFESIDNFYYYDIDTFFDD